MKFKVIVLLLSFMSFGLLAEAQSKKELKAEKRSSEYQETKALIESGVYEFVARSAHPNCGSRIDLTTNPNFIRSQKGEISLFMPFFGRAFSAPYGGGGGFEFEGKPIEYSFENNEEKMVTTIQMKAESKTDVMRISMIVSYDGYANLTIISNNREQVSYFGNIDTFEIE